MRNVIVAVAFVAQGLSPAGAGLPSFGEPGISPDGSTIAFVSGGDIWEVPARGGDARLLVSHPATESRPLFSPDGLRLAFTSTRSGNGDVYVLALASGDVTRLTFDDANELVSGWSADSQSVLFQSSSHEISGMLDVYSVGADTRQRRLARERRHADGDAPAGGGRADHPPCGRELYRQGFTARRGSGGVTQADRRGQANGFCNSKPVIGR